MAEQVKIVAIGASNTDANYAHLLGQHPCYTEFLEWLLRDVPPGKAQVVNRGVAGHTLFDMETRFRRDVIDEHPEYAIILGGTNDAGHIAYILEHGRSMPSSPIGFEDEFDDNPSTGGLPYEGHMQGAAAHEEKLEKGVLVSFSCIRKMCDMALAGRTTPIVCTVPPYGRIERETRGIELGRQVIKAINHHIRAYCGMNRGSEYQEPGPVVLADLYQALLGDNGEYMHPDYSRDMLHINGRGHAKAAAVLFRALTNSDIELELPGGYKVSSYSRL